MKHDDPIYRLVGKPLFDESTWLDICEEEHFRRLRVDRPDEAEGDVGEVVYVGQDNKTTGHLVEDPEFEFLYVGWKGPEGCELWERIGQDHFHFFTLDELLNEVTDGCEQEEGLRAIQRLGIAAPPQTHPEVIAAFERVLQHPEPRVRREALVMTGYRDWDEWEPILRRVVAGDRDADVRELAQVALEQH